MQDTTRRIRERIVQPDFSRILFETCNEGVIAADVQDILILCNPKAEQMFGYPKKELIGLDEKALAWNDEARARLVEQHQSRAKGEKSIYPLAWRRKDGSRLDTLVAAAPIIDDSLYIGNYGFLTDITELKMLQERLRQTELIQIAGQMGRGMAHEINNKLTIVIGYLSQLMTQDKEHKSILGEILSSVQDIQWTADNFLNIGRTTSGEKQAHYLAETIEETFDLMKKGHLLDDYMAVFEMSYSPLVFMEKKAIRDVLINLARNAAQAMGTNGVLTVGTRAKGDYVETYVRDTGQGIKPEVKDQLFKPLFTTKKMGSGFGLYIAKSIVDEHKGYISVESEPGKGAEFFFGLPIYKKA